VRELRSIVDVSGRIVNRIQEKLAVSNSVAPQIVGHYFSRLAAMRFEQTLEETYRCLSVSARLQKHIDHFTILIDRTPKIVLLALDLHKDFIYEEGIAITPVPTP
jgi:hypothetical protein